jgi:hypothetical protein
MLSATLPALLRQPSDRISGAPKQCADNGQPIVMKTELEQTLLQELKIELASKPVRLSKLAEHDGLIAKMREAGATWRTVSRYMAKAGIEISAEAIRSYWHRHHKSRRRPTAAPASNQKPQSKPWTFNPPSTLE